MVEEANVDFADDGISLQAMDSAHVSLVSLKLRREGFDYYRCDSKASLGVNLRSMGLVMKVDSNSKCYTPPLPFSRLLA